MWYIGVALEGIWKIMTVSTRLITYGCVVPTVCNVWTAFLITRSYRHSCGRLLWSNLCTCCWNVVKLLSRRCWCCNFGMAKPRSSQQKGLLRKVKDSPPTDPRRSAELANVSNLSIPVLQVFKLAWESFSHTFVSPASFNLNVCIWISIPYLVAVFQWRLYRIAACWKIYHSTFIVPAFHS